MAVSNQKELKPRASCTRILENKTELHIVVVRPLNVSSNIKAEDGRWLNTLFISDTQIHVFLQINNRHHNRVIFLFCHFASVSAVTVCLQTRGDGWSYFCCFYIWRLRCTSGCHSDCWQGGEEKKRGEEKKIRGRGGGGRSEHGRNQLRAQRCWDEQSGAGNVGGWRWGGQSQTVPTDVFHSDSLIHCWWEQQRSTIRFSSIYLFCDVSVQMTWWRLSPLLIRDSHY